MYDIIDSFTVGGRPVVVLSTCGPLMKFDMLRLHNGGESVEVEDFAVELFKCPFEYEWQQFGIMLKTDVPKKFIQRGSQVELVMNS